MIRLTIELSREEWNALATNDEAFGSSFGYAPRFAPQVRVLLLEVDRCEHRTGRCRHSLDGWDVCQWWIDDAQGVRWIRPHPLYAPSGVCSQLQGSCARSSV